MAEKFEYDYKAPTKTEREEIEAIRNSYMPKNKNHDKLKRLRSLDARVKNIPMIIGMTFGVIGILVFGLGMTFALEWNNMIAAVIIGIIGVILMGVAYPLYNVSLKYLKNKYMDEILAITAELLSNNNEQTEENAL